MRRWTREHDALLNALQAASIVPTLYRRMSLERYTPDADEVRRLRDWATSLRSDPAWEVLEPVAESPAAWPDVWQAAVDRGFSPRTDHHNALLLARFCDRFLQARDYEGASWAWRQAVASWARVFRSPYPGELFDAVAPNLGEDGAETRGELLRTMLDDLVASRVDNLRQAAGLTDRSELPTIDRRLLRFAHRALKQLAGISDAEDPYATLRHLAGVATTGIGQVNAEILRRFEALGKDTDLSAATGDAVVRRFRWAATYFEIVGLTEGAVTTVVSAAVETCWTMRKLDRDERPEFGELLDVVQPLNRNLAERLRSFESAFGHNSQCADFLVFLGERERDSARKLDIFREGLAVCPGHRNSAMLAAWELVNEVRVILLQTALTPPLVSRVAGPPRSIEESLQRAWALCNEAERIYAFHEELPGLREKVSIEAERHRVSLPDNP